jgi:iron complex outermembrane receptor protein
LSAYEIGTKSKFFDNRVSLTADFFLYDYKSYQAYVLYGPNTTIKNLGAKEHGVEVEFEARPFDPLTLDIGVSALRSKVNDVTLPDGTIAERTLPQAPTWSGHALARYEFPVADAGKAAAQWLVTYTGYDCFTVLCGLIDQEAGHAASEGRISYTPAGGRWELAAFVKNAFNRVYRVFDSDTSFIGAAESIYAPPRWWGVTGTYRFGAIEH